MAKKDRGGSRANTKEAIRQLTVNYALGTDAIGRSDLDGGIAIYRETFLPGAEIRVAGMAEPYTGPEHWAGYVNSHFRERNYRATQHLMGTVNISVGTGKKEGTAVISSYLHAAHAVDGEPRVFVVLGTYDDECVRKKGRWWIARRTLTPMASWWEGGSKAGSGA